MRSAFGRRHLLGRRPGPDEGMRDASSDAHRYAMSRSIYRSLAAQGVAAYAGRRNWRSGAHNNNDLDAALEKAVEERQSTISLRGALWSAGEFLETATHRGERKGPAELNVITVAASSIRRGRNCTRKCEKNKAKAPNPAPTPSTDRELYAALKSRHRSLPYRRRSLWVLSVHLPTARF